MASSGQTGIEAIATAFVTARRRAEALPHYPGTPPTSLDEAYAIQAAATALFDEPIVGWKVGRVPDPQVAALGVNRLAGPIFASGLFEDAGGTTDMPVFAGGFAAVEAEFVAVLRSDPPAGKTRYTMDEAAALIAAMHCGVEIASSPLASINADGSAVTISDFGNNQGLIVGDRIGDWAGIDDWTVTVDIDGARIGAKTARAMLDGPVGAVRFLLETAAERGLPLKAGALISTGAVSGVHEASIGAEATATFGDDHHIRCRLVAAEPTGETRT